MVFTSQFLVYRSEKAGGSCRVHQFLKHQVHAEVVLVWLIIVRYVSSLVLSESRCLFAVLNGAEVTVSESLELPSPWDSLLSCVYNVQYFFHFVNRFCTIFTFSTNVNRLQSARRTKVDHRPSSARNRSGDRAPSSPKASITRLTKRKRLARRNWNQR